MRFTMGLMAVSKVPAFDPATLFSGGIKGFWLAPSDMSTMWQDSAGTTAVTAANQPVGKMVDKSPNAVVFTQSTSSKRPTLRNSGSLWWLEFDGSDDRLDYASTDLGATINDAVVCAAYTEVSRQNSILFGLHGDIGASPRYYAHAPYGDGNVVFDAGSAFSPQRLSAAAPWSAGASVVVTFTNSPTGSVQSLRHDGTQFAADSDASSLATSGTAFVGSGPTGDAMVLDLHSIIAVLDALTNTERDNLEDYCAGKQGRAI